MDVLRLGPEDFRLLVDRFVRHGNSHLRMVGALRDAGAGEAEGTVAHLEALRRLERRFAIDLGALCHRAQRTDSGEAHPLEEAIVAYVSEWSTGPGEPRELRVWVDRVRNVRVWMEGGALVEEPGS